MNLTELLSLLLLFLLRLDSCHGFSSLLLSPLKGQRQQQQQQPKTVEDGAKLLKELGLKASTEPVLANARAEQIPTLLAASNVAVFRAGSGIFGLDYKISLTGKDESKYSYVSLGNYQLRETCLCRAPELPIVLYDNESCPFCRQVREACSMLSLTVWFRPVPQNGRRFRPEMKAKLGKRATFPYMMDPNSSIEMSDSTKIIDYLFARYGQGDIPWTLKDRTLSTISAGLGLLARFGAGGTYHDSNPPKEPLILWAYEGLPFSKIVRERLCSLELEHKVIYTPRGSPNRQRLFEKTGRFQVPYFEDPNTGVTLFESEAIVEYLDKMYSLQSPVEYM